MEVLQVKKIKRIKNITANNERYMRGKLFIIMSKEKDGEMQKDRVEEGYCMYGRERGIKGGKHVKTRNEKG